MNARQSEEIEQLYLEMYSMLYEYARSSLSGDALAEEAVQETFRVACQKPEALCTSANPRGWLVNTLKFVISNMKKSRLTASRILTDYFSSQLDNLAVSQEPVGIELLYSNMADTEEFQLIKEMAVDGRSYLEMSQARGITLETCRKRVQRAKESLRKKIQK